MPRTRTGASRLAAVALAVLALVLLERALHATTTSTMVLEIAVALLAVLAAVTMWVHNGFESHLVAVLVASATAVGTLLSLTLGMPGSPPTALSSTHVVALVCSAAIGLLLVADARARGTRA